MSDQADADGVFTALLDERRRLALRRVREHRSLALADVADEIAADERGVPLMEVSAEFVRDVYLQFYHCHLPALRSAGLVRYDQEHDLVTITDRGRRVAGRLVDDGVEAFA